MNEQVSRRALITFAMVNDELLKTNDFLRGIAPIFTPIAHDLAGQVFNENTLGERLQSYYGLKIPSDVLALMPARLQSMDLIERRKVGTSVVHFWKKVSAIPTFDDKGFSELVDLVTTEFELFIKREPNLITSSWSRDKIDSILFNALLDGVSEVRSAYRAIAGDAATAPSSSEEKYIAARFIKYLSDSSSNLFARVGQISNALMVSEVIIELGTRKKSAASNVDLNAYIDAPIIMDYMGLSGKDRQEYAKQIIAGLRGLGVHVLIFDHSVDEIKDNLRAVLSAPAAQRHGPTASAILSRQIEEEFVGAVMHSPEHYVEESDIQIVRRPKAVLTPQQKATVTPDDEEQIFADLQGIHAKSKARDRDALSIHIVMARRQGHSTSNIFRSKHIFVTHNERVSAASKKFAVYHKMMEADRVPPAIDIGRISAAVWLQVGIQDKIDIERKKLLAACARTAAVNPALIDTIRHNLRKISPQNADQYEAMITQPRYLQISSDVFLGDEQRVTADSAVDLFDRLRLEMSNEERQKGKDQLREQARQKNEELRRKDDALRTTTQRADEAVRRNEETFERIAASRVRIAHWSAKVISASIMLLICILAIVSAMLIGLESLWSIIVGLVLAAVLAGLGFVGFGYKTVQNLVHRASIRMMERYFSRLGLSEEWARATISVLDASVTLPRTHPTEQDTGSRKLL